MSFWNNKKVLITGHTGFKGSWLCWWLKTLGAKISGFSLNSETNPSLFNLTSLNKEVESVYGDIRDFEILSNTISKFKPDIIFHFAAQALVRKSYKNPIETFSTNVMGTVNLFEAVKSSTSTRVVINVTSDKCYENKEWLWGYRENDPIGGDDPYSCSKGCSELITKSYKKSFFNTDNNQFNKICVSSVRAGNVIGGGDFAEDRLIPDIIYSIMKNEPIVLRNPNSIRPWQHVLEPLNGYMLLAKNLWNNNREFSGEWNFGPDTTNCITVEEMAKAITSLWGENTILTSDATSFNPHESRYLKLDCTKAKTLLRWKPILNFEKSLDMLVHWYKEYSSSNNMKSLTISQITEFERIRNNANETS